MINVLVVGAGAVGCLVGGQLATTGCQVTLLGRARLAQAIETGGLHLQWPDGERQTVHPHTVENLADLADLATFELVLVTVKSFDTNTAVRPLAGRLSSMARVLSLQNGVGNEEQIARLLPGQPILAGSITLPVMAPQVGTIVVSRNKGGIGLASMTTGAVVGDIAQHLQQAGFTVTTCNDYRSLKWSKLMMNITGNASSAILDMPPGQSLVHRRVFDLELGALRETVKVMAALDINVIALPGYPMPWLAQALRLFPNALLRRVLKRAMVGGRGDKLPSLQLDLRKGRNRSEVRVLNEVVALEGQKLGLSVPVNRGLSDILNGIVSGRLNWDDYRGKPDFLWAQIQEMQGGAVTT